METSVLGPLGGPPGPLSYLFKFEGAMGKSSHGGRRAGSGRKIVHPEGKSQKISITVPARLVAAADAWAAAHEATRSEAFTEAVRRLVGRKQ